MRSGYIEGYIKNYSHDDTQQIEERAFNLRQLLRMAEFSVEGCQFLQEHMQSLLDNKLAVATLTKYFEMYDVNYANKQHVTLLHLLVLCTPHLVGYLLENPKFTRVNYKAVAEEGLVNVSALELAISRWLDGDCHYQVIERLLKYGAQVPALNESYMHGRHVLSDISYSAAMLDSADRTESEMVDVLVLLGRYGFKLADADGEEIADLLEEASRILAEMDHAPERLVELTEDRLATLPPARRLSHASGFALFTESHREQSLLASALYGEGDELVSDDDGLVGLFTPGK